MKRISRAAALALSGIMTVTLCASMAVAGFAAESGSSESAGMEPGVYTASADGFEGGVTVEVEVNRDSILSVKVIERTDVPNAVAEVPCAKIPGDIVRYQSVNVDNVSGATFTSLAIKTAVKDCLEQAGGKGMFTKKPPVKPSEETEDTSVDILVIGGGASGCMAALAASSNGLDLSDNGLSVMLVEKQAMLGGSATFAGGSILMYDTDEVTEEWLDAAFEQEMSVIQEYNDCEVNEALLRHQLSIVPSTIHAMEDMGAEFTLRAGNPETDIWYRSIIPAWEDTNGYNWWGQNYTRFMQHKLGQANVDVRLNTKATELVTDEEGAVTGAVLSHAGKNYTVTAKKVILACGGFAHNRELIEKYAPDFVGVVPFAAGGNVGDGLVMAVDIGAATVGSTMAGYLASDYRMGIWEPYASFQTGTSPVLDINILGERYNDESVNTNVEFANLVAQPEHRGFGIIDSDNPDAASLEGQEENKNVFKADTLEELAELIDVPADALLATVEKYNQAIADGEDAEFHTPVEMMDAVETAPFYAIANYPVALTSLVSLDVSEDCEVLTEAGEVIPNLYASGDMVLGGYLQYYVGSRGFNTAIMTGRLSGEMAKEAVMAENEKKKEGPAAFGMKTAKQMERGSFFLGRGPFFCGNDERMPLTRELPHLHLQLQPRVSLPSPCGS